MKNVQYYNDNAQTFYDRTINADVTESYKAFLKYLPQNAHILDAGCGVGRDTKYFLSKGYQVTAFDASQEMVELASKETGTNISHSTFQEMNFDQVFNGVWAQASLIHVPYEETKSVYEKIYHSLKPQGIFYAAYKHGENLMPNAERDFYNMTKDTVESYFNHLFEVLELWTKKDNTSKVAPSPDGLWLDFIVRKLG